MKQCMDSENLHRRLKKIIGQVQAIDRMIDEDVPCEDVLYRSMQPNPHCTKQDRSFWKDTSNTASVKESNMEIRTRPSKTSQKR